MHIQLNLGIMNKGFALVKALVAALADTHVSSEEALHLVGLAEDFAAELWKHHHGANLVPTHPPLPPTK